MASGQRQSSWAEPMSLLVWNYKGTEAARRGEQRAYAGDQVVDDVHDACEHRLSEVLERLFKHRLGEVLERSNTV